MSEAREASQGAATGELMIVGVSHRSASAMLRDSLFIDETDQPRRLAELHDAGVAEAILLSTCDRVEIIAAGEGSDSEGRRLAGMLTRWANVPASELEGQGYVLCGTDALRHLFAVAASLDSQVIGEPQVLGQVKDSHRRAAAAGMTGSLLEPVLQAAYAAAKRVRSETPVAEQPVTIAASALRVARDLHGELDRCSALIIGLGEMGELLAGELKNAGLGDLAVTHHQERRAEAASRRLRCHLRPWDELESALAEADIVVAASGTGRYQVTRTAVQAALKRRRRRPMFLIDAAIPGDIEPAVQELDEAFVYTLDDLERVARRGRETREGAAIAAWKILGEELSAFSRSQAERAAVPALAALRRHVETLRRQVLDERELDAEAATRLFANRLLHAPSEVLREAAAEDPAERQALERLVARLFRIDPKKGDADT